MFPVLSLCLLTLSPTIAFQESPKPKPVAKETYLPKLIFLQNAKAEELAKSLQKAFGSTVTIQPTNGSSVSGILVSGPPPEVDSAVALIEKLDRAAKEVTLEVIIVEASGPIDLPGSEPEKIWIAQLSKVQKEGIAVTVRKIQLNLRENRETQVAAIENRPIATGSMGPGRNGVAQRNYSYTRFGTTVTAKPRFEEPNELVVEVTVEDSRSMRTTPGLGDKPEDFPPDSTAQLKINSAVKLKVGQVTKLQSSHEQVKSNQQQIMVFLLAK